MYITQIKLQMGYKLTILGMNEDTTLPIQAKESVLGINR